MKNKRFPNYPDDTDYTTNAPSYYDDLARKEKLIRLLAERIWGYEKILDDTLEEIQERFRAWDKNLEDFPEDVKVMLQVWMDNGTFDHIINETIFNWKLDTIIFEQFRDVTATQLAEISTIYLPQELTDSATPNIGQKLETFLNNCSNKTVIFPSGVHYELEKQVVLSNVNNLTIDFNNCAFKAPDNCPWVTHTRGDVYIAKVILAVINTTNITLENLILDGNKVNNVDNNLFGVMVSKCTDVTINKFIYRNINYHAFHATMGAKRVNLYQNQFYNNYGSDNSSDVYVYNNPSDSVGFYDTYFERDELDGHQCFYIDGWNTTIKNTQAKNIGASVVDYRRGRHTLDTLTVDNAETALIVQTTSYAELPEVFASNIHAVNLQPDDIRKSGIYIVCTGLCFLSNVHLSFKDGAATPRYGVRIRRTGASGTLNNVTLQNITSENNINASIMLENLDTTTIMRDMFIKPLRDSAYAVEITADTTATQVIDGLHILAPIRGILDPNNLLIRITNDLRKVGTTTQRPTSPPQGFNYVDTTLAKPIWRVGTDWVDGSGAISN